MARRRAKHRKFSQRSTSGSANGGAWQPDDAEFWGYSNGWGYSSGCGYSSAGPSPWYGFKSWAKTADWGQCLTFLFFLNVVVGAMNVSLGALVVAASAIGVAAVAACKQGWLDAAFSIGFGTGKLRYRAPDNYCEISVDSSQGEVRVGRSMFAVEFPPDLELPFSKSQWLESAVAAADKLRPKSTPSVKEWNRIQQEELQRIFLRDLYRGYEQAYHQPNGSQQQQHTHHQYHSQHGWAGSSSQHSSGQQRQQQQQQQPPRNQPNLSHAEQQAWTAAAAVQPDL